MLAVVFIMAVLLIAVCDEKEKDALRNDNLNAHK